MPVFNRFSSGLNRQVLQEGRKVSATARMPFSFFDNLCLRCVSGVTIAPEPRPRKGRTIPLHTLRPEPGIPGNNYSGQPDKLARTSNTAGEINNRYA